MNETIEERLSMLLDGEVTPFETKRLVDEIDCNPHMKALWLRMNKQRAALKGNQQRILQKVKTCHTFLFLHQ